MTEPSPTPEQTPTPLVLLHGVGQAPMAWEDVVVALYGSRPILTPWVPGLKPTERRAIPLEEAAAALDQQLMLEGMEQVDLVGLSHGAMVAMRVAADFPERVRRLVLIAGQASPPKMVIKMQRATLKMVPTSRFASSGVSKDRLLQALDAAMDADLNAVLPTIEAESLVLVGSKDKVNQPGSRALVAGLPHASLRIVDGAGHALNQEAPGELVELLKDFLDR